NISYSMYALHQPIGFYWDAYGPREFEIDLGSVIDFTLYFGIVLGASALSYLYVELPLRRRIRRLSRRTAPAAGAAPAVDTPRRGDGRGPAAQPCSAFTTTKRVTPWREISSTTGRFSALAASSFFVASDARATASPPIATMTSPAS